MSIAFYGPFYGPRNPAAFCPQKIRLFYETIFILSGYNSGKRLFPQHVKRSLLVFYCRHAAKSPDLSQRRGPEYPAVQCARRGAATGRFRLTDRWRDSGAG